jgi:GMP synthase (glutamine-hydrolysing)
MRVRPTMRNLLVLQHVPYEPLGTLNPLLKREGYRIRYVNFGREPDAKPQIDRYNGLVVLGGPMSVTESDRYPHLSHEAEIIADAIDRGMPVLGICLGAQLIAKALGADVRRHDEKEIGWYRLAVTDAAKDDAVFSHFENDDHVFQWHGDTFEIPAGATHLATTSSCHNQAFRYGDNVYGLQFHLECDEPMIDRWLRVPHHVDEIESTGGKIDPQQIRTHTPRHIGRLKNLSDRVFGEFVRILGYKKRLEALPSR